MASSETEGTPSPRPDTTSDDSPTKGKQRGPKPLTSTPDQPTTGKDGAEKEDEEVQQVAKGLSLSMLFEDAGVPIGIEAGDGALPPLEDHLDQPLPPDKEKQIRDILNGKLPFKLKQVKQPIHF